jgi:hypothetical protein
LFGAVAKVNEYKRGKLNRNEPRLGFKHHDAQRHTPPLVFTNVAEAKLRYENAAWVPWRFRLQQKMKEKTFLAVNL